MSTSSPKSQKVVQMKSKQLKKINDNLSQLCDELDIDDMDLDVGY